MDLMTPTAHAGAYEWASVLLAHVAIGLGLVALLGAVMGRWALPLLVLAYGLAWEGLVQGYGAGMADALVDTFAVAMGGLIGLAAWRRWTKQLAGAILSVTLVLWAGVRRRG